MTPRSPFQRFTAELRRRHVPQTAAVYAVAAWAAIQFADVVVPNLGWPQGVVTAVIIASAIGLPAVLALAWFLEWGPDGIHRTEATPEGDEANAPGRGSYAPWATAVGVLSIGIAAALVVGALRANDGSPVPDQEAAQTRSARRQAGRDSAPFPPPPPPRLVSPAFRDSLAGMIDDSVLRELDAGDGTDIGELMGLARRIREASARVGAGGPVEIGAPETWRFGAPEPVRAGDTIHISGIARAEEGVRSVEVDGRVVARSRDGAAQLPFEAAWVAGEGRGFRRVTVVVRTAGGEAIERHFSVTLIPPSPGG